MALFEEPPEPPPQPQQQPPPNFNYVHCPKVITNFRSPLITKPVMKPNQIRYVFFSANGSRIQIPTQTLRNLYRDPAFPWAGGLRSLMMEGPIAGQVWPAHFPSINDIRGMPAAGKQIFLHLLNKLDEDEDEDSPLFPSAWSDFVDPEPNVRDYGRIFLLTSARCMLLNAVDCDAIDIFHVMDHMSLLEMTMWTQYVSNSKLSRAWVNKTRMAGYYTPRLLNIPIHTSVVIWNVRGVNRLLFPDRFKVVVWTHSPKVIILMETRCFNAQFKFIYEDLKCEFRWRAMESSGLLGGFIVLWDDKSLCLTSTMIPTEGRTLFSCVFKNSERPNKPTH